MKTYPVSNRLPRPVILILPLLILTLLLSACGTGIPQTGASLPEISVDITDTEITLPESTGAGITTLRLNNTSQVNRSVNIARLNTGVTLDQFMAALNSPDDLAALQLVALAGGGFASAGQTSEFSLNLKEGAHVVLAFPEEDQPPLTAAFQVGPATGATPAPPQADYTVELADFTFIMPETVQSGSAVWTVTNTGSQWHEFVIIQPDEGFTQEQFLEMMGQEQQQQSGPPPFQNVATFGPITQGERGWMTVDLPAGRYWAICFLPDVAGDMTSHVQKGMFREFTVN